MAEILHQPLWYVANPIYKGFWKGGAGSDFWSIIKYGNKNGTKHERSKWRLRVSWGEVWDLVKRDET